MWANAAPTRLEAAKASFRSEQVTRHDLENPFATVLRRTWIPMIVTDPSGVDDPIVFANAAFCRMAGYRLGEILGRNCRFLQGVDTDKATIARISAALQAREPIETDIQNYRKNGSPFLNRLLIAPVLTETGSLAYFFASQIDVTAERGAASEGLQAALKERQLVTAALGRLQGVEAVCHLSGGIAHNFNNLLDGIRGSLAMLQGKVAAPVRDRSASLGSGRNE